MAAPTFGSSGSYVEDGTGTTENFPVPSGVAAGDIIVLPIFSDTAVTITVLPAGFAHAEGSPVVAGTSHTLNVLWKRATGADAGTYDVTFSAAQFRSGAAHRYTGAVASGSPWDSPTGTAGDGAANSTITPAVAVTTAGPDRLLIFAGTNWSGGTWTPPTGFTERMDTGFGLVTLAEKLQAAADNSGSVTATCTGSDRRAAWLGGLIGTAGGGASVAPAGISVPVALGSPTLAWSGITTPDGVAVPVALGAPSASVQATGTPDGIAVPVALGAPTLIWSATIAPAGISVPVVLGSPIVGAASVNPDDIGVPVTLGAPALTWSGGVAPDGIAVPVAVGSPIVGAAPVAPDGIGIPVALGAPSLTWSAAVSPDSISVPVVVGAPTLAVSGGIIPRPDTGTITRPDTGVIIRSLVGVIARLSTGIIARP